MSIRNIHESGGYYNFVPGVQLNKNLNHKAVDSLKQLRQQLKEDKRTLTPQQARQVFAAAGAIQSGYHTAYQERASGVTKVLHRMLDCVTAFL